MATIKDIAKKAKVSVTTVSRALNDYDDVNIDTKRLIQKVAEELNYVPNKAARNLVMKQSKTLAFILSGLEKEGGKDNLVYRLLAGMFEYAGKTDYEVVLYTTDTAHQKKKSYLQYCKENNIAGVMVAGIRMDDPYLKEIIASDIPCVLIDIDITTEKVSCITIDNVQAAFEAVELLVNHKHKNIGMVNGRLEADVSLKRHQGYKSALEAFGIDYREDYVVNGEFLEETAEKVAYELLSKHTEITALFCASDMMAIGAMKAAESLSLKIPEDLSVIGFDDVPFAQYMSPALGTVRQDFYLMGYHAGKQLVQMLKHDDVEKKIYIEHKVLARETVLMIQ